MPTSLRRATSTDAPQVLRLYDQVIAQQAHDAYGPSWTRGVYPTEDDLRGRIDSGDLYLMEEDESLVGALVLTTEEDSEYLGIHWPSAVQPQDVSVIHLLAVSPQARGRGLGLVLVKEAAELARSWGKRAIHLDVVPGNLAASRIYLQAGFTLVCHHLVHYEDLGDTSLEMYELVL